MNKQQEVEDKVTLVGAEHGGGKIIGMRELYDKKKPHMAYYLYRLSRVKVIDKDKKGSVRVGVAYDKQQDCYQVFIMGTNDRKKMKKLAMEKEERKRDETKG
jgi:hypothetical protein